MLFSYLLGLMAKKNKPEDVNPMRSLSNVKEVDKVLLMYIYKVKTFSVSQGGKIIFAQEQLGFCQQQLGLSLKRLFDSGHIRNTDNGYVIATELSIANKDKVPPVYVFNSDEFLATWDKYLEYRRSEFSKPIKSTTSKENMVKKLARDCGGDEDLAIAVINETMNNNWIGLIYGLKQIGENAKHSSSNKAGKGGSVIDIIRQGYNRS